MPHPYIDRNKQVTIWPPGEELQDRIGASSQWPFYPDHTERKRTGAETFCLKYCTDIDNFNRIIGRDDRFSKSITLPDPETIEYVDIKVNERMLDQPSIKTFLEKYLQLDYVKHLHLSSHYFGYFFDDNRKRLWDYPGYIFKEDPENMTTPMFKTNEWENIITFLNNTTIKNTNLEIFMQYGPVHEEWNNILGIDLIHENIRAIDKIDLKKFNDVVYQHAADEDIQFEFIFTYNNNSIKEHKGPAIGCILKKYIITSTSPNIIIESAS